MLPLLVLVGSIAGAWYLLIVRPQAGSHERHQRLVERLVVGDHVMTIGGIYGRVTSIDGPSLVLDLGSGVATRIAVDGVARIVHAGEAAIPELDTPTNLHTHHPTGQDVMMQQDQNPPQHPQNPAQVASPWAAPPQPFMAQVQQPQQYAPQQYAQPSQQHAPQQPQQVPVTLRAHVEAMPPIASQLPVFQPRGWQAGGDAPVQSQSAPMPVFQPFAQHRAPAPVQQHQQYAPQPQHAPQPYASKPQHAPQQYAQQPQYAPQQYAPQPQPAPQHQQFALQQQYAPQQHVQPPVQAYAQPQQPMQLVQQFAQQQPVAPQPPQPEYQQPAHAQQQSEQQARHARTPQGMGSLLRLDDPSIAEVMHRARSERTELAEEYRRMQAPLVDASPPGAHGHPGHVAATTQMPVAAGPGNTLFAQPAGQYPASVVPRPVVQQPNGPHDPALQSAAFQRPAPYSPAPTPHEVPSGVGQYAAAPA